MDFTSQDIAVIEQALQMAARSMGDESKARPFCEVLLKLKAKAAAAEALFDKSAERDGFRFDYDDSAVIY
ncbi:hypothetical protein [Paenibacillus ginsengihumi]|uniref:hypothetical protein n=1 Tax=Paenibacillus ginsengihumi TaxID=431596 RepID=UPI0003814AA8|nr:hypothetical protein [Paenibacillus ginsengihumi]